MNFNEFSVIFKGEKYLCVPILSDLFRSIEAMVLSSRHLILLAILGGTLPNPPGAEPQETRLSLLLKLDHASGVVNRKLATL